MNTAHEIADINIWDMLAETTGANRHKAKCEVIAIIYGHEPRGGAIWDQFVELLHMNPHFIAEWVAGKETLPRSSTEIADAARAEGLISLEERSRVLTADEDAIYFSMVPENLMGMNCTIEVLDIEDRRAELKEAACA